MSTIGACGADRRRPGSAPRRRPAAGLAVLLGMTMPLAAACGGSGGSAGTAASAGPLYQQARTYTGCMRSRGVPDFPEPRPGPGGTLIYPLNPPAGMLASPSYDAAYRACLKLAVTGGRAAARYRATALSALKQAECMHAHGIASYPAPVTINGGLHVPDFTTPAIDPHTPQFQAAGKACGLRDLWMLQWWWQAGSVQP